MLTVTGGDSYIAGFANTVLTPEPMPRSITHRRPFRPAAHVRNADLIHQIRRVDLEPHRNVQCRQQAMVTYLPRNRPRRCWSHDIHERTADHRVRRSLENDTTTATTTFTYTPHVRCQPGVDLVAHRNHEPHQPLHRERRSAATGQPFFVGTQAAPIPGATEKFFTGITNGATADADIRYLTQPIHS